MAVSKWYIKTVKHVIITLMSFGVVAIVMALAYNISFLSPIANAIEDFSLADIVYQVQKDKMSCRESRTITIVDMTALDSRRKIAAYLDTIEMMKPKVVGVDIVFEGEKSDAGGDLMVLESVTSPEAKNMVFSYKLNALKDVTMPERRETHSFFLDEDVQVDEGFSDIERNLYGGMKRTFFTGWGEGGKFRPSLITAIANKYSDGHIKFDKSEKMLINFTPTIFPKIRYDSVKFHPELIEGRTVIYGGLTDQSDMHYTPIGKKSGVEVLAYALNTLYNKETIKQASYPITLLLSFIIVLIVELGQFSYERVLKNYCNDMLQHFFASSFIIGLLTLPIMIFTVWVSLSCMISFRYYVDAGLAISAMLVLDSCRDFYNICEESWSKRKK